MINQTAINRKKLPITKNEINSFATTLFEFSSNAVLILDAIGKIVDVNPAFCLLLERDRDDLIGKLPEFLFSGQFNDSSYKTFIKELVTNGYWSSHILGRNKNGTVIPIDVQFSAIYDEIGMVNHYIGICSSINSYLSSVNGSFDPNKDVLTGLLNSNSFFYRLEHLINKVEKNMSVLSLVYINIDSFKDLASKDKYLAGDIILKNTAKILTETLDKSDTIARLKADIFCIVLEGLYTQEEIEAKINLIYENLRKPYAVHPSIERIQFNIGVAIFPISGMDANEVLNSAINASKQAKKNGTERIIFNKKLTDVE